ncbi:hypothetical protein Tco_1456447 [Tanacetum coccineum]
MTNKIDTVSKAITDRIADTLPSKTAKNSKLSTSLVLSARSYPTEEPQSSTHIHGNPEDTNTIAYIEEQRDTPLLERKDITVVGNLGSNKYEKGIEWLDVEEPLDLVDTRWKLKSHLLKPPYKNAKEERIVQLRAVMTVLSSRVILSEDDYNRGCRKPSDLEDGFYKDTIKLGPEYLTGMDDEGEVMGMTLETIPSLPFAVVLSNEWVEKDPFALEDNANPRVSGVFSTWMAFGGNTCELGLFREETDEITDLHQIHEEILFKERGDDIAGIKRCRRDPSSNGVRYLVTGSRRGQLNEDLESSM